MASPDRAPSPRGAMETRSRRFSSVALLKLNVEPEQAPVDGSSWVMRFAGDQARTGRVHSSSGTY